jgi:hypothetical protein
MPNDKSVRVACNILDESGEVVVKQGTLATVREVGDEWFIVGIAREGWHSDVLLPHEWTEPSS